MDTGKSKRINDVSVGGHQAITGGAFDWQGSYPDDLDKIEETVPEKKYSQTVVKKSITLPPSKLKGNNKYNDLLKMFKKNTSK